MVQLESGRKFHDLYIVYEGNPIGRVEDSLNEIVEVDPLLIGAEEGDADSNASLERLLEGET